MIICPASGNRRRLIGFEAELSWERLELAVEGSSRLEYCSYTPLEPREGEPRQPNKAY